VNLYFFVLTPAPDDDDDALKLLDPLAATLQIGERMDVRPNGDENRTMKAFTAIGQLWRMIMLGSSQRAGGGLERILTSFSHFPSFFCNPFISPWPWPLLE
jgi:hypothetical protein